MAQVSAQRRLLTLAEEHAKLRLHEVAEAVQRFVVQVLELGRVRVRVAAVGAEGAVFEALLHHGLQQPSRRVVEGARSHHRARN